MKLLISLFILLAILSISCSQSANPKPIVGSDKEYQDVSDVVNDQKSAREVKFDLNPTFESAGVNLINSGHSLRKGLLMYHQAEGNFPNSIKQLASSDYLLFWPRNEIADQPIQFVENPLVPDENSFYDFTYVKLNDSQCELKNITFDKKAASKSGNDEWRISNLSIPNGKFPAELDELKAISIICGKKSIEDISNSDVKAIYILAGQLANYLTAKSGLLYREHNMFPTDFIDLFDGSVYILSENLTRLSSLIDDLNADFRWGFDSKKSTEYCYLKIGTETFIDFCVVHGTGNNFVDRYNCDVKKLDMSEPLISSSNIASLGEFDSLVIKAESLFPE